jgi:hypothetical protein
MLQALNVETFLPGNLTEDAYVAMAGRRSDGVEDDIRARMAAKFPAVTPRFNASGATDGIVAYAYLQKRLPFVTHFDRMKQPLRFHSAEGDADVQSFGIEDFRSHRPREKDLRRQVSILDYVSREEFVLQLETMLDHIVLARVPRAATLAEALAAVKARIAEPVGRDVQGELDLEERLEIPLLSLFVEREYTELMGRSVLNSGFTTLFVADATQLIRFQLDESGAIVESEAQMEFLNGDHPPPEPRQFLFDGPFLIYLQERKAQQPYFVMWVENAEVLVPAEG